MKRPGFILLSIIGTLIVAISCITIASWPDITLSSASSNVSLADNDACTTNDSTLVTYAQSVNKSSITAVLSLTNKLTQTTGVNLSAMQRYTVQPSRNDKKDVKLPGDDKSKKDKPRDKDKSRDDESKDGDESEDDDESDDDGDELEEKRPPRTTNPPLTTQPRITTRTTTITSIPPPTTAKPPITIQPTATTMPTSTTTVPPSTTTTPPVTKTTPPVSDIPIQPPIYYPPVSDNSSDNMSSNKNGPVNHAPVLNPIGDKTGEAGKSLSFTVSASDSDNDTLSFSAFNLPAGALFDASTQTFTWEPFTDGVFMNVGFKVSDGKLADSKTITITIERMNYPPFLSVVGDKKIPRGSLLEFTVTATDQNGDDLTYSASNLPKGAAFDAKTRIFSWTPSEKGEFKVTFRVSDGKLTDSEQITITVEEKNYPPVLNDIGDKTAVVGEKLYFTVYAANQGQNTFTYSASNLPPGAAFNKQYFEWTPSKPGTYPCIVFSVTNGTDTDSEAITIYVASDDGQLPGRIVYRDNNTGLIYALDGKSGQKEHLTYCDGIYYPVWSPDGKMIAYTQASDIYVKNISTLETKRITFVGYVDSPPRWSPDGAKLVYSIYRRSTTGNPWEDLTSLNIINADGTGQAQIITGSNARYSYPEFSPDGNRILFIDNYYFGAGGRAAQPALIDINNPQTTPIKLIHYGDYRIQFIDMAKWSHDGSEILIGSNKALHVINALDNAVISLFKFAVSSPVWSPDGQWITFNIRNEFTHNIFEVYCIRTDGSRLVRIKSIGDSLPIAWLPEQEKANNPPALNPIGNKTVTAGETLQFTVTATDPDGDSLFYSASNLPPGATFDVSTHIFTWNTSGDCSWTGVHFAVSDCQMTDTEDIGITVNPSSAPQYTLTVNISGQGTVIRNPSCSSLIAGTRVQLTAMPQAGWVFSGWGGALSGAAATAVITINADTVIAASFTQLPAGAPSQDTPLPPPPIPASGGPVIVENDLTVIVYLNISINEDGKITEDINASSIDNNAWVIIPGNTVCKTEKGTALSSLSIEKLVDLPSGASAVGLIGNAYSVTPDGATFNPSVLLNFRYDPSTLPEGVAEQEIKVVWWDSKAKTWIELETAINESKHVASAKASHCSVFALMARPALPAATATAAKPAVTTMPSTTQPAATLSPVTSAVTAPEAVIAPVTTTAATTSGSTPLQTAATNNAATPKLGTLLIALSGGLFIIAVVVIIIIYLARKEKDGPGDTDHQDKNKGNPI